MAPTPSNNRALSFSDGGQNQEYWSRRVSDDGLGLLFLGFAHSAHDQGTQATCIPGK